MALQPKKFLVAIDLNKKELLNAVVQNLATAPSSPLQGQIYFNTGDNILYGWNGTAWVDMMGTGGGAYTHPGATNGAYNETLSGATVLATFQTDAEGHVDSLTTRTLTLADLGYTPYSHPTDGVDFGAALTGAAVISDVTVNTLGHVTGFATRNMTAADIGAAIINDALTSGTEETWSIDKIKTEIGAAVSGGTNLVGNYDAATNTPNLDSAPTAGSIKKGDMYVVSVDGLFYSEQMRAGDVLIAKQDDPTTVDHWIRAEKNQDIQAATESTAGLARFATAQEITDGAAVNAAVKPDQLASKIAAALASEAIQFAVAGEDDTATANRAFNLATFLLELSGGSFKVNNGTWDYAQFTPTRNDIYSGGSNSSHARISTFSSGAAMTFFEGLNSYNNEYRIGGGGHEWENGYQVIQMPFDIGGTLAVKYSATIGDGAATSFVLNHALKSRDVVVQIYDTATFKAVEADVEMTDINNVTINFAAAPTAGQFRVTIIGA